MTNFNFLDLLDGGEMKRLSTPCGCEHKHHCGKACKDCDCANCTCPNCTARKEGRHPDQQPKSFFIE
jgi:hypothetical protein